MSEDLKGLSAQNCPYACNPQTGCVITGSICGHPFKGGLQTAFQTKPDVLRRFNTARAMLDGKVVQLASPEPEKLAKPRKAKRRPAAKKPKAAAPAAEPAASTG